MVSTKQPGRVVGTPLVLHRDLVVASVRLARLLLQKLKRSQIYVPILAKGVLDIEIAVIFSLQAK
jgi:hypothetical protein